MKSSSWAAALAASCVFATAHAQEPARVEFSGASWRVDGEHASVQSFRGREALNVAGRVWLERARYDDFVLEFDAYFAPRGFVGVIFRAADDENYEDFYLRNGYSGNADAFQYMPIFNGISGWQTYTDARFIAAPEFATERWVRIKLVVIGDAADIYIDGDRPIAHVPDLQRDRIAGGIGLRATESSAAHFANFTVRRAARGDSIVGTFTPFDDPPPTLVFAEPPTTLIRNWRVSNVFAEDRFASALALPDDAVRSASWTPLGVEVTGIANLARVARRTPQTNTVMVQANIRADAAGLRELRFGYSDRLRLYLNGQLLFTGVNGWQARDWNHYGRVGLYDSVALPLRAGDNTLIAVVSETFGGWGFMADLPDRAGVAVSP